MMVVSVTVMMESIPVEIEDRRRIGSPWCTIQNGWLSCDMHTFPKQAT
jgi:hypothetical protein